ncbi:MAG TPA: ABC transporter ATP-binding protein [Tepidisphaeraceae bacterium]|nr:ABC transporter ATP-binding protein [Tepidisphaeraceae bacterium]
MARPETVLAAERMQVRFGGFQAVRDVSLALKGRDLLGLIGPNGAGKTTLLRALAGIQPVTRGVVRVLGEPLAPGASHLLRHIGFTPDTPPVYEDLTVREFLRFIAKGYELAAAEADERIDFWLEKVWLAEKANVKIRSLSRGMRQRIGIARTLLPNPSIVLLDEPSAGLDPAGRVQFRQLLVNLREQGKALIVSSHILLDMADYCTHIGIMSKGQLVRYGTVAEVSNMGGAIAGDGAGSGAGNAAAGDPTRCRYTITLAHPQAGTDRVLESIEGVAGVQADGERIVLEFSSSKDDAAALLARMIALKIPVAAFSPNAPGLEEAYLRTEVAQVD